MLVVFLNLIYNLRLIFIQKHIVKYIDIIEDNQNYILIIKYIIESNLKQANKQRRIISKETKIVSC